MSEKPRINYLDNEGLYLYLGAEINVLAVAVGGLPVASEQSLYDGDVDHCTWPWRSPAAGGVGRESLARQPRARPQPGKTVETLVDV